MLKKLLLFVSVTLVSFIMFSFLFKPKTGTPTSSIYDIEIKSLTGEPLKLSDYKGKFVLFVNVASECGFTPQYKDLETLYSTYKDKLMVIGVPCNQFGGQEPGTAKDIQTFCQSNYGVSFVMTEKVDVKGENQHPLYKWLTNKELNNTTSSTVKWNFQKYLVNPEGQLVNYFFSNTEPLSDKIVKHLK
ncbi:MAG TPA: glutathione peroxidase [Flavobacteriaceae bacterium]|nr:glutathione peroxidase [Flavobacteriaceae bacterium]